MEKIVFGLRRYRSMVSLVIDATVVALAWQLAFLFRLAVGGVSAPSISPSVWSTLLVVLCYLLAFSVLRLPHSMWRFVGFHEARLIATGVLLGAALSALGLLFVGILNVPRAVLLLHPIFVFLGCCLVRFGYRFVFEWRASTNVQLTVSGRKAVILGAGSTAQRLLATLKMQPEWQIVAMLDDDVAKHHARINKVQVLGSLELLRDSKRFDAISHAIVAMPSASAEERKRAIELAKAAGMSVFTVPSLEDIVRGTTAINHIQSVEAEDLLGRETVSLNDKGLAALVGNACVLVTGAGGSIGSELCRQIAKLQPACLVLFELSEFALYQIEQQLSLSHPNLKLVKLVGDVKDKKRVDEVVGKHQPNLIFHAAAYKHVPLMEEGNEWQAVQNNTFGTYCVASAARAHGVERFILISTDKAVNPTNVMGATKRAAEMVLSNLAARGGRTKFMAVRFGNVLGSSGSVIPKFKEQIASGGPVTVTHPEMTRYFMTIPEAAVLVMQAAAMGDTGQVYVLDMGDPVKILDMARNLISMCGKTEQEIPIVFTGLRPGEKLFEELLADSDTTLPTAHPKLRIAILKQFDSDHWFSSLLRWIDGESPSNSEQFRYQLKRFVPEYAAEPTFDSDNTQPITREDGAIGGARRMHVSAVVAFPNSRTFPAQHP